MPYTKVAALYAVVTVLLMITLAALAPHRRHSGPGFDAEAERAAR